MALTRYTPLRRTGFRNRDWFHAKPVHEISTGRSFGSRGEYRRWGELQLLEKAGNLSSLVAHPKIVLIQRTADKPEIAWHPDATYIEAGRLIAEDYKPRRMTDVENLLFKLWKHYGPCPLRIVGNGGKLIKQIAGK